METALDSNLIIVGGPPRSGTTLVQNVLDMHPEVTGAPEFLHFPDIARLRQVMTANVERGWLEEFCTQAELDEYLRRFVGSLFAKIASLRTTYISEKTPQNVLCFKELGELFPNAKFINVVRDPRAIVASLLEVYRRAKHKGVATYPDYVRDAPRAIAYTMNCLKKGQEFSDANAGKVHTVRYEDLVIDPKRETEKLCDYLGLSWTEAMLYPSSRKHMGESAITRNSGEIWYDKAAYYRDPDRQNLEKWRQTLSRTDTLLTGRAFAAWGGLDSVGYRFDLDAFSPTDRFVVALRESWARVRRVLRRLFKAV